MRRDSAFARWVVLCVFALASTCNYLDRQILAAAAPLVLVKGQSEWLASDSKFQMAVEDLSADYAPWFKPVIDLEALGLEEYEPYLFEFQAFLGMAAISAMGGWMIDAVECPSQPTQERGSIGRGMG